MLFSKIRKQVHDIRYRYNVLGLSFMIIDGKKIADEILCKLREDVVRLKECGVIPELAVIVVGDDAASRIYVNNKKRVCENIGIRSREYCFPSCAEEDEIAELILELNGNTDITGILVQLPLPKHINSDRICQMISPDKDVDCFHEANIGKLFLGKASLLPCTPQGILEMLKKAGVKIKGAHCVVVGRSNIVGKPLAMMLLAENGTVTVCHSKTRDLQVICKEADILVCAVGVPNFIKTEMVKPGATVVDVGINRKNNKICGDVDFENVKKIAKHITPVPGGVGPMTIAMLMKNTVTAAQLGIRNSRG